MRKPAIPCGAAPTRSERQRKERAGAVCALTDQIPEDERLPADELRATSVCDCEPTAAERISIMQLQARDCEAGESRARTEEMINPVWSACISSLWLRAAQRKVMQL